MNTPDSISSCGGAESDTAIPFVRGHAHAAKRRKLLPQGELGSELTVGSHDLASQSGFYQLIDGRLCVLFRESGEAWLRVDSMLVNLAAVSLGWTLKGDDVIFKLRGSGHAGLILRYTILDEMRWRRDNWMHDFTQTSPEDFDLLLFATKLNQDPPWLKRFARGPGSADD